MKRFLFSLAACLFFTNSASAQSVAELRRELERERLITEIANTRAKRDELNRERDDRRYQNEMRDIYIQREEQQRAAQERSSRLRNVNELITVIGTGTRMIEMIGR